MVSLHMVGGKAVFYSHRVSCKVPQPPTELPEGVALRDTDWKKFRIRFRKYRIEPDAIYCENSDGLADIEKGLGEIGISYTVEDISPTDKQAAKAKEVAGKVGSPKEVLDYVLSDVVPERIAKEREIANLKAKVAKLESKK